MSKHLLVLVGLLAVCWNLQPASAQTSSFWCMSLQNFFGRILQAGGCTPPWTSQTTACVASQNQYKNRLSTFGCVFVMPVVPCNAVSGARCVPQAWNCTQSTGACGTGNKCCGPVNGQCDCRNGQSCLLPMECAGVPGAVVNADKACYAAPTTNYVCCQEPTCDTRVGDRCVPSDYVCTTSNSGPCRAGYQCCRQPTGQCGVGQDQACKTVRECWSRPGTSILADLTCADSSQICCHDPPPPVCDAGSGDRCLPDTWTCTTSSSGPCSSPGTKCCGPSTGPCAGDGRACGKIASQCLAIAGAAVIADLQCGDSSEVCCQVPACDTRVGDRCVPSNYVCTTSNSGPCRAGYQCCRQPTGQCGVGQDQACKTVRECWSRSGTSILADLTCADPSQICCHDPPVCDAGSGDRCLPDTWTCTASSSGPCSSPGTKCCGPSTGPCAGDGRACGKTAAQCLAISGAAVIADQQCGDSSEVCCQVPGVPCESVNPTERGVIQCCKVTGSCTVYLGTTVGEPHFCPVSSKQCCKLGLTANSVVSQGKPASQSSNYQTYDPNTAVDGNNSTSVDGNHCSYTTNTDAVPWWQVDLQNIYVIYSVTITNRDCSSCGPRLRDFSIKVYSSDPVANPAASSVTCTTYSGNFPQGGTIDVKCDCSVWPILGRYLRVINTPNEYLTLCEVQVYGIRA